MKTICIYNKSLTLLFITCIILSQVFVYADEVEAFDDIDKTENQEVLQENTNNTKALFKKIFQKKRNITEIPYAATVGAYQDGIENIVPTEKKQKKCKFKLGFKKKNQEEVPINSVNNDSVWSTWNSKTTATTRDLKSKSLKKVEKQVLKDANNHKDTINNIYLDKYKRNEDISVEDYYRDENIIETTKNNLKLDLDSDGKYIDNLIEEIENVDPTNSFTPPVKISVKDCIGISIAKNPSILSSRISTDIYKDQIAEAWSAYFPTLSIGANYNRSGTRYKDYGETVRSSSLTYPSFNAGLLLFDFGKTKTAVDVARTSYDASRYDLQDSIHTLIYSVKSAYYNLLFAEKQIEVYKNTIEEFDLQLQSARKFFEIGKKPQIDVVIAEYNAGNARLNEVKAENTLQTAKVILANVLGLPEFANFALSDELTKVDYDIDLDLLLKTAFTVRPDLISAEKSLQVALLGVRSAKRSFTPDITADGSLSNDKSDDLKTSSYGVGVNISYGALNFMQLKKELDIAKKAYSKALADYESVKQSVYSEIKQAYINYETSIEGIKQAELNVNQAKAQNYHAMGRYKAGYGDAIELKDSENTYMNAQLSYYEALLSYNLSVAELEKVVGKPIEKLQRNVIEEATQTVESEINQETDL